MTKQIELTQELVALVDDQDYEWLIQQKWYAVKIKQHFYAACTLFRDGHHVKVHMHRAILDAPEGVEVDHVNGNGLDNRRTNLRYASRSENSCNRGLQRNNTSGYKGVFWHKRARKWMVRIEFNGKVRYMGYFADKIEAALTYNKAALKLHGPFARLNEIKQM